MVLTNKKPAERNRNILNGKRTTLRKKSEIRDGLVSIPSSLKQEGHLHHQQQENHLLHQERQYTLQEDKQHQDSLRKKVNKTDVKGDKEEEVVKEDKEAKETQNVKEEEGVNDSVSMESMVCLKDTTARILFNKAINHLRNSRFIESLKLFQEVTRHVQGLPAFGEYAIYRRTQNKKTSLSALYMFQALAYEGLSNPRKAIECCNSSISEDPGWPIPFSKRSDYFSSFEQTLLDTDGAGSEEIHRDRTKADITVDPTCVENRLNTFNNLQEALDAAKDGDEIFLEKGFYYREEGYTVTCGCSITGASSRGVTLVSKGNPTMQIIGGKVRTRSKGILISRIQFRNKIDMSGAAEGLVISPMTSNAAHIFVISPENVTIRDCLFIGGPEETGGILVAEEAFYQSLLELEYQNPELLQGCEQVSERCLRLLINNCIFSDCKHNSPIFSNSQCTVIISNSCVYNCSTGIKAQEGSTVNILNSEIRICDENCIEADTVSTINIRGGFLAVSGSKETKHSAGVVLRGNSKANIAKSLFRNHKSAINSQDSDVIFESNCVMDIGEELDDGGLEENGLQLQNGAICMRGKGNCIIQRNNFHNCSLVFLIQNEAEPTISNNNIETCLIGIISGTNSAPKMAENYFQCILMSIGIFIEGSRGSLTRNVFRYVANGLDVYRSSAPNVVDNTFFNLALPGLNGTLAYDIQKVKSGRVEDMEGSDIITFSCETDQQVANHSVKNRFQTIEKTRVCSNCRQRRHCSVKCGTCQQIFYCSLLCQANDKRRHLNFCALSLKDML